jgi:TonB family protein
MQTLSFGAAHMIKNFAVVCAVAAMTGFAHAQAPPTPHALPTKGLHWLRKPNGSDIAAVYPQRAIDETLSGRILIECQVTAQGRMSACTVLNETPINYGFGDAALKLSRGFVLDPKATYDVPLEGGVIALPIILVAPYRSAPLGNDTVGEPAALITVGKGRNAQPCPTSDKVGLSCVFHSFAWDQTPDLLQAAPLVRAAVGEAEISALVCGGIQDRHLADCLAVAGASPQQETSMRGLIALMTPPAQALDKTPMTDGEVLIQFHWPVLRQVVDRSILTRR